MNYFVIGATVIVVGAGVYYLLKSRRGNVASITPDMITLKEVDFVKLSCVGPWLKEQNVDSDDFGKTLRLYAFKDIKSKFQTLGLPKSIMNQVNNNSHNVATAFVLTDMESNTKQVLIFVGKAIDDSLKAILNQDVTEIHLK